MRVLITGVAGLIGSNLARYLLSKNIDVIGVDNLSGGYLENVPEKVRFYRYNLLDIDEELEVLFRDIDIVYHCAAYAAEGLSPFMRCFNYKNNLETTAKIVNRCINSKVKRLVYFSSMSVYGNNKVPFEENYIPAPIDPYGVSKYAAEMDIRIAHDQHKLDYCIIRPHNVYGPNQNIWDKYRNVIGIWMRNILDNEPLLIYGDGSQRRAFTYIDDILEPLWIAGISSNSSCEVINLGGIADTSILATAQTLLDITERGSFKFVEARHEVKEAYSSWSKSEKLLNYKYKTTLQEGLREMWVWAKKQPKREVKIWDQYEIERGLYAYWKKS